MSAGDESESRELALLRLVERDGGEASWYRLERELSVLPVPPAPNMMQLLKQLAEAGLVSRAPRDGGMDAWALTEAGERWLAEAGRRGWPLGPLEAEELARQVAPATLSGEALRRFSALEARRPAALRQLLALGATAAAVVRLAHGLDDAAWRQLFAELKRDPLEDAARAALEAALRSAPPPASSSSASPAPAAGSAPRPDAYHCHIGYPEGVTACGAPPTREDVYAWRTEKIDGIVHRATFLAGPGGRSYVLCERCIAAHGPRR